jgi:thiamine-phosphate pyrophosphorylase
MTDERLGDLLALVARLPRGTGVVFRHHATPLGERRRLLRRLAVLAASGRIVLVRGGEAGIGGAGLRRHGGPGAFTWPVHDRAEAVRAVRRGARVLFVSPVFPTRSHPGARSLGPRRAAAIVRGLPAQAIALGGMNAQRFRHIERLGFHGWAAIDAWAVR